MRRSLGWHPVKYLFLLLFPLFLFPLFLFSGEQRILLTGVTIHEHSHDRFDEKYNAFNYGAGYEYNFFEAYNELYFASNVLVLNDSFENPQLSIGFGHRYRFDLGLIDLALGITGFVGWKKIYTNEDTDRSEGDYGITGGVGPSAGLFYDKFSINFIYVPPFAYEDIKTTGFLLTYFSYKF